MRCEDYPCCGHVGDEGPCPDFDPDTGKQLDMKCVCGASVPPTSRSSLCRSCLMLPDSYDESGAHEDDEDVEDDENEWEEVEECFDCGETRNPCSCSLAAARDEYYAHGDD